LSKFCNTTASHQHTSSDNTENFAIATTLRKLLYPTHDSALHDLTILDLPFTIIRHFI